MGKNTREGQRQNAVDETKIPDVQQIERVLHEEYYRREHHSVVFGLICILTTLVIIVILIFTIFFPVIRVYDVSMSPTIQEKSITLCKKKCNPKRGDVMAFYYNDEIVIRRVIGLSGDEINITEDGLVTVNGENVEEEYVVEYADCGDLTYPYTVPDGNYFMLADNRSDEIDSRNLLFANIQQEDFIGKVIFCVWPINQLGFIQR